MPEHPPPAPAKPLTPLKTADNKRASEVFPCDRCGAEMYRMHAVWRCPACGYKSDCCGW